MTKQLRITKRLKENGEEFDPVKEPDFVKKAAAIMKSVETGQTYKVKGA